MVNERSIARVLLTINAIGFVKNDPIRFKSGILSPVYTDNRKLPFFPKHWRIVLNGKRKLIKDRGLKFDVIAGVAAGGIPHSAALGFIMKKPSVFIRKETKDHGTAKLVEGGDVKNKTVLLIEDLVTMGGSSLSAVQALRDEGATVKDCLVIVNYGFPESAREFKKAKVNLHALAPFTVILTEAISMKKCSAEQAQNVREWLKDPWTWTKKREPKK
jgi:orotate phosphoribosyltransferase